MNSLQERIANERRRLRSVRQNMLAAIEKQSADASYVPFYIATANYIEATMQRVHRQDVRMDRMIRDKVAAMDASVEQALSELNERLVLAEQHLKPFLAARDALQEHGAKALEQFAAEGQKYSDFIVANMGHHPPTADLGAQLFSAADWEYMAGSSAAELEQEDALFKRLQAALPAGLPLTST